MQLRLTQKYAKDCRIPKLNSPVDTILLLDDWVIDVIRVHRKKVAMASHFKSMLTFFIPYSQVGGAVNIPECIGVFLEQYLCDNNLEKHAKQLNKLFKTKDHSFCKTDSRKIIGHMTDLKYIFSGLDTKSFDDIDWTDLHDTVNKGIIKFRNNDYESPNELILNLLTTKD